MEQAVAPTREHPKPFFDATHQPGRLVNVNVGLMPDPLAHRLHGGSHGCFHSPAAPLP
ncbi:hypothetical protein [Rubidibacter lacunae]|uniref:hypothetical protein n=1 Tax=Rubidibacter lacunae TaxID=582514 RepID=UPI0018DC4CC0|nr:hypothetical protein [Rubidibacter lacunae]